jgi:hypothetical protein
VLEATKASGTRTLLDALPGRTTFEIMIRLSQSANTRKSYPFALQSAKPIYAHVGRLFVISHPTYPMQLLKYAIYAITLPLLVI